MEWEYKVITKSQSSLLQTQQMLNDLGKQGWLVVAVDSPVIYLVREIVDEEDDEPYYR